MRLYLLCLFSVLFSLAATAADLKPTEVYAKCHARLSDHPVNMDSAAYKSVEAGTLDPVQACLNLLNRANFVAKAGQRVIDNANDQIALGILRNFDQFHQSWFSSISSLNNATDLALYNFVDVTEPALFITDALFGNKHYRTVFTTDQSLRGVRVGQNAQTTGYFLDNTNFINRPIITGPLTGNNNSTALDNVSFLEFPKITIGQLIGVENQRTMNFEQPGSVFTASLTAAQMTSVREEGRNYDLGQHFGGGILGIPVNFWDSELGQHFGGGILGSAPYLVFSSESRAKLDGGVRIHRRYASNTFYDLMCLDLPNLNNADVDEFMERYKDSDISFRQDRSCARCHATLDPFADAARNLLTVQTSNNTFRSNFREAHPTLPANTQLTYIKKYVVRTNEQTNLDSDDTYHRRRPNGQLHYRNFNGNLVKQNVNGVADLGAKIANQNDIYVCAAQKYYHFLTGVNIKVSSQETSDFYKKHRADIVKIGLDLKNHGSLKTMIGDILKTDAFQSRFPGAELEKVGE